MLQEGINGFCMALADSVPGVSGGTVAFIMGFYDRFIGSVHDLAFGRMKEKKSALKYLAKLGAGWVIGMAIAAVVLSALFESHIYIVSSLFIGFVGGAVPLIVKEEKSCLRDIGKGVLFCLLGIAVVAGITWANSRGGAAAMDLGQFSISQAFFHWYGCGFCDVSSGNIWFHAASDFRSVYAGYYSDKRCFISGSFVSSVPDLFWMRHTRRGGDGREGNPGMP